MIYSIEVSQQAKDELDAAYFWLAQRTEHAFAWHGRILEALRSLQQMPERCPIAPEYRHGRDEVRHLIVGDRIHGYRIIFTIRASTVYVLDILHCAREK